jgi:signal transduction histidine kinase
MPDAPAAEIDAAIEETDRLRALVNDLLQLARADARPATAAFDLARLTADRVDTWSAVADTRNVEIDCGGVDHPTIVTAVPGAIEQILDNLLDTHSTPLPSGPGSPPPSPPTPNAPSCASSITAPGSMTPTKPTPPRRFWRGDTSHPGTGLGLAIVDTLATASAGTLTLQDTPGGGLTAITTFPRADTHRAHAGRRHPHVAPDRSNALDADDHPKR